MKYRLKTKVIEPHIWSPDNPHPNQEEYRDGEAVIRTGPIDHYTCLKTGDAILSCELPGRFEVIPAKVFLANYEPVDEEATRLAELSRRVKGE